MTERTLREQIAALQRNTYSCGTVWVRLEEVLAILDAHTAAQPAPDAVAEAWQPIDTAPEEPMLLLFEPHDMGGFMFAGVRGNTGQWINNLDMQVQHPTHWMPLPPAPQLTKEPRT